MSKERPIEVGDMVQVINSHCSGNRNLGLLGKVIKIGPPRNPRIMCGHCFLYYPTGSEIIEVKMAGKSEICWQRNWLKRIPPNEELGISQTEVDDLYMPKLPVTKLPEETRAENIKAFLRDLHALNARLKRL